MSRKNSRKTDVISELNRDLESDKPSNRLSDDNFEVELSWCLNKLQQIIDDHKAERNEEKLIKSLRNQKTPFPKKRLLMNNYFGDYRNLMKQEMTRYNNQTSNKLKIKAVDDRDSMSVSRFIKKSNNNNSSTAAAPETTGQIKCNDSAQFKFNFTSSDFN